MREFNITWKEVKGFKGRANVLLTLQSGMLWLPTRFDRNILDKHS